MRACERAYVHHPPHHLSSNHEVQIWVSRHAWATCTHTHTHTCMYAFAWQGELVATPGYDRIRRLESCHGLQPFGAQVGYSLMKR